jgi:hypothetical protein
MYAFAAIAFTEFKAHTPALEQFGNEWFGVLFFSLLITAASIVPKLASGVPLKDLLAGATSDNMTGDEWWRKVRTHCGSERAGCCAAAIWLPQRLFK